MGGRDATRRAKERAWQDALGCGEVSRYRWFYWKCSSGQLDSRERITFWSGGSIFDIDCFFCNSPEKRTIKMDGVYFILIALVIAAIFGLIISYREDHPRKSSSDK